ncbi:MAG TPA: DedA family protein [Candidatus Limnocylindrales bacterium]|nr:DedA family protein [Candidatus Limnocylindrales bacterium]
MGDPGTLIGQWGYLAIFVLVAFGNMGVPLPEETILMLAGYMVWRGELRLPLVIGVGVVSAAIGDTMGYWLGRRFGKAALQRHAAWIFGGPERLEAMQRFVARRGPLAVFVARFVPGLRFAAGPLAGALGMPFASFLPANLLGAAIYVPLAVGAGYAIGYGLGAYVERARHVIGNLEDVVLLAALGFTMALIAWRVARRLHRRSPGG